MARKLTYTQELQIEAILDKFDFGKVAKVMEQLEWLWVDSPLSPEPRALRAEGNRLLEAVCVENAHEISCGGFAARKFQDGSLRLVFQLEEKIA